MNRDELLTKLAMEHAPDEWGDAATWTYDEHQFGWNEYQLRRTELINRPSWDDAPEWAQWVAQDEDGEWAFFPERPNQEGSMWTQDHDKTGIWVDEYCRGRIPAGHNWRDTLEQRPADIGAKRSQRGVHYRRPSASTVPDGVFSVCYEDDQADRNRADRQKWASEMWARGDVEAKQSRYTDNAGEDWIDEFARTATMDEFRGAMRFTIGKYNRRMGRKDDILSEVRKMRDYCQRWEAYEDARK